MGVWHKEVIRLNGRLLAYIEMQDDWTGNITKHIREIYCKDNMYYCNVLKQVVPVNNEREAFLVHEDAVRSALDWYNKTKF